jgi:hypothetical protein
MTAVKRKYNWGVEYKQEVERSIKRYNHLNQLNSVYTRQLTSAEILEIFEKKNYDYIKNIGRNIDGLEWKELNDYQKVCFD